jgi:phosphoribosylformylglycinamidine (FGAM) synthase-like enzyme
LLTVKFVELFQIVQVGPRFALHAVEFLNPGLEAKDLWLCTTQYRSVREKPAIWGTEWVVIQI